MDSMALFCNLLLFMTIVFAMLLLNGSLYVSAVELPALSSSTAISATEYWDNAVPGVALPAALQERLFSQKISVTALLGELHASKGGRPVTTSNSFCQAAHLYCNPQYFEVFRSTAAPCNGQFGFRHVHQRDEQSSVPSFFRESVLVEGAGIVLGDQIDRAPMAPFLPRQLADMLHPANERLLQEALGIPVGSRLSKESVETSTLCEKGVQKEELLEGEEAFCALSLEDLAEKLAMRFAGSQHKPELLTITLPQSATPATSIAARLLRVELRASEEQPYLSCHAQTYPFALHFCHHIPNTRIYSATLYTLGSEPQPFSAVAICHLDTSGWDPRHVAFSELQSAPGTIEACHWTHEHGLVFVPAAN